MILNPFQPSNTDPTIYLAVTGTAQSITSSSPSGRSMAYRLVNNGTQAINFLVYPQGVTIGSTAAPVATTSTGMQMLAGTVEMFTLPPNAQFSVIASTTGSTLSVTPGEGA